MKPARFKRHDRVSAAELNALRQAGLYHAQMLGANVHMAPGGVVFEKPPQMSGAIIEVMLSSVGGDFLKCVHFTPKFVSGIPAPTPDAAYVYVAKPFLFRPSHFDGKSVNFDNGDTISYVYDTQRRRTATKGADSEVQVMTPDYLENEILYAFPGYTGIPWTDGTKSGYCYYTDLGIGRAWAKEPT